jgi:hypothetical protein
MRMIKERVSRFLQRMGYSVARMDDLTYLANTLGSDKGTAIMDAHGYTRIYTRLFEPLRDKAITFVEMGLFRHDADRRRTMNAVEGIKAATALRAPSLEMWRTYFPRAHIYGFDIDDFSQVNIDKCTIIQGDMSSENDLNELVRTIGRPIDILIDDASHASHHQQIALGRLFPHLQSGGIYIIEDLLWQDKYLERPNIPTTRDVLRRLQIDCLLETPLLSEEQRRYVQENVAKVRLFDNFTPIGDDGTDALGILFKK